MCKFCLFIVGSLISHENFLRRIRILQLQIFIRLYLIDNGGVILHHIIYARCRIGLGWVGPTCLVTFLLLLFMFLPFLGEVGSFLGRLTELAHCVGLHGCETFHMVIKAP
ncbi:hypothetical protein Taro_039944 [Colocasia esculenta]|uniref:Uncharacterized protein n=1 Tax=Colocasia esculenta TaxID=4460 RepID=A0A843WKC6_COLES|nr:hypothetical protein [Colocasia esculenta]